mgnify:CR=1 FL=1
MSLKKKLMLSDGVIIIELKNLTPYPKKEGVKFLTNLLTIDKIGLTFVNTKFLLAV